MPGRGVSGLPHALRRGRSLAAAILVAALAAAAPCRAASAGDPAVAASRSRTPADDAGPRASGGSSLAPALAIVVGLEAAAIGVLLAGLLRRRRADASACRRLVRIAHLSSAGAARETGRWLADAIGGPLASTLNNLGAARRLLLRETPPLEEVAAAVDEAQAAGETAARVVNQLRALLPDRSAGHRPVDLNAVVREALRLVARGRTAAVTAALSPLPPISGDRGELLQVVLEVVLNALEVAATAGRGAVSIRTRAAGGSVELWVDDSGAGTAEEGRTPLLTPLFATDLMGLGAGLAAARSIVESYGGRIAAESPSGVARFRVTFPAGTFPGALAEAAH